MEYALFFIDYFLPFLPNTVAFPSLNSATRMSDGPSFLLLIDNVSSFWACYWLDVRNFISCFHVPGVFVWPASPDVCMSEVQLYFHSSTKAEP